jgi:hypothetical protein
MWQSIINASWANIWSATVAISTVLTLFIALIALFRWKKQDELKVKLAFKNAISNYAWLLAAMPEILSYESSKQHPKVNIGDLTQGYFACMNAWDMSEGLMDRNKSVSECWAFIQANHNNFIAGRIGSSVLIAKCRIILREKIIFKKFRI